MTKKDDANLLHQLFTYALEFALSRWLQGGNLNLTAQSSGFHCVRPARPTQTETGLTEM